MRWSEMDRLLREKHPELSSDWKAPRVALFYLCKDRSEASFDDDIMAHVASSPFGGLEQARQDGFEYVLHESRTQGRFTVAHIEKVIGEGLDSRLFFLCGPTSMMEALGAQLLERGVSPRDIFVEDFNLL